RLEGVPGLEVDDVLRQVQRVLVRVEAVREAVVDRWRLRVARRAAGQGDVGQQVGQAFLQRGVRRVVLRARRADHGIIGLRELENAQQVVSAMGKRGQQGRQRCAQQGL